MQAEKIVYEHCTREPEEALKRTLYAYALERTIRDCPAEQAWLRDVPEKLPYRR